MKPELIERLYQINRTFYSTFATSFSETRESARELEVILPYIADGARVLDLGCGNGRVAKLVARHRRDVAYVGVDASAELVARGKMQDAREAEGAAFFVADIAQPEWIDSLPLSGALGPTGKGLGMGEFDCVLLLAVLHHIPGSDVRARILRQARELVAPQGRIVVSAWQFMDNKRMRKKIVPWSVAGIDERELEPGDALLNWKRDGEGVRYCHWIGQDEMRALAAQVGLSIVETFRAGGREGNLSLYAILSRGVAESPQT
jgi:tRNA (uracil-5-)-methyltransferase TRM9